MIIICPTPLQIIPYGLRGTEVASSSMGAPTDARNRPGGCLVSWINQISSAGSAPTPRLVKDTAIELLKSRQPTMLNITESGTRDRSQWDSQSNQIYLCLWNVCTSWYGYVYTLVQVTCMSWRIAWSCWSELQGLKMDLSSTSLHSALYVMKNKY
jgi:hypothetical protein